MYAALKSVGTVPWTSDLFSSSTRNGASTSTFSFSRRVGPKNIACQVQLGQRASYLQRLAAESCWTNSPAERLRTSVAGASLVDARRADTLSLKNLWSSSALIPSDDASPPPPDNELTEHHHSRGDDLCFPEHLTLTLQHLMIGMKASSPYSSHRGHCSDVSRVGTTDHMLLISNTSPCLAAVLIEPWVWWTTSTVQETSGRRWRWQ